MANVVFQQYKLLVQDTARLSDRRQTANTPYLSANSLLLGGIALLVEQSQLKNTSHVFLVALVVIAGTFLCVDWRRMIGNYRKLINLRIELLKEIELGEGFPGPIKTYMREETLYPAAHKKRSFGFTRMEANLPLVFGGVYWLAILGTVIFTYPQVVAQLATAVAHLLR